MKLGSARKQSSGQSEKPIGVFDSGIGGLTVAHAIKSILPEETLVYFGDTAHLPYGDKSADSIKYYGVRIAEFLLSKNCKTIVIACNTASSLAFEAIKKHVGARAEVINVIDPVVDFVAGQEKAKKIGVIGTKATIRSDVYAKKIKEANPALEVSSLATPLLAPMIEEGFFNNKISKTVIGSYLEKPKIRKSEALILACTHYPLIKNEINEFFQGKTTIIDSAHIVALFVKKSLEKNKALNQTGKGTDQFFVSEYTASFEASTKLFFKGKIRLQRYPIWENE